MSNQLLTNQLASIIKELERRANRDKFKTMFADKEMYPKHNIFFEAGAEYKQRLFLAANRVGKTTAALCEITMHLTGEYPDWWKGKRFNKPNHWWTVSKDTKTIIETIQPMLLGPIGEFGTGLIPSDCLDYDSLKEAKKSATAVDTFRVKHKTGGYSSLMLKSASSGRAAFQGTEKSILIDEECPYDVYEECLLRTMTGENIMLMSFTPLMGITTLIKAYYGGTWLPGDLETGLGKYAVQCEWKDAPHITEKEQEHMYASMAPHQREARSKGVPSLGAGLIYPVPESTFVIAPFEVPKHWKKVYALDVGWRVTAACWGAVDPETGNVYIYSEHYLGETQPAVHAASIKARGEWVPGVIDSAANGRSQIDGENLMQLYKQLGLNLVNADKAIEAGLYAVWELLSQGRLKIMSNCTKLLEEMRLYRRDEKGRIVKEADHLCDCLRYLIMKRDIATTELASAPVVAPMVSHQYRARPRPF